MDQNDFDHDAAAEWRIRGGCEERSFHPCILHLQFYSTCIASSTNQSVTKSRNSKKTNTMTKVFQCSLLLLLLSSAAAFTTTPLAVSTTLNYHHATATSRLHMIDASAFSDAVALSSSVASSGLVLAETEAWVQPAASFLDPFLNLMSFAMVRRLMSLCLCCLYHGIVFIIYVLLMFKWSRQKYGTIGPIV